MNAYGLLDRAMPPPRGDCNAKTARAGQARMFSDWNLLSDDLQISLSREALLRAARSFADQAEILAEEMEDGSISDRGGPDALRLLAAVVRLSGNGAGAPMGHA